MALDTYLFTTKKDEVPAMIQKIREAVEADTGGLSDIFGFQLVRLDEDEMNHVDKLNPAVSWVQAYGIHEWFSRHVLHNKPGSEENQLNFVTQSHLRNLIDWCEKEMENLSLLNVDQAYQYSELQRTSNEAKRLLDTIDFGNTAILYFAYW